MRLFIKILTSCNITPDLNNLQLQPIAPIFASTPKPNIFQKVASKITNLFKKENNEESD